jgi:hypothetical protein
MNKDNRPAVSLNFADQKSVTLPPGTPVRALQGMVKTVEAEPTGTPRSFFEQFRIFDGALWFYDTVTNLWQAASGGGGAAGSSTQVQVNDGGNLDASADFRFNKAAASSADDGFWVETLGNVIMTAAFFNFNPTEDIFFQSAALPTNADRGFIYIPSCAGTPTGTPANYGGGGISPLVYDYSNNKLYIYNGTWKSVTLT